MKKIAMLSMTVAMVLGSIGIVKASENYNVDRISGVNRYETSINIASKYSEKKFENVIIANGNNFPDALSGSSLSKKIDAPILLVDKDVDSSKKTLDFIKNKLKHNGYVYILGEEGSVGKEFEKYFKSIGIKNIKRLGGKDRFETNEAIINSLDVEEGTPVVIVNGYGFADVLSISSVAASKKYPIIISDCNEMTENTKKILKNVKPSKVYIVGGDACIGKGIFEKIKGITSLSKDSIVRIFGRDRYETSLNICKYFSLPGKTSVIANGENFPDALAGSALAGKLDAPIILMDGKNIDIQKNYLDVNKYKDVILLGGKATISQEVEYILGNKPVIPDSKAEKLLFDGDEEFKKVLKIDVDGKNYIDREGISFAKINDDVDYYGSIENYLEQKFNLNRYFSKRYIKNMIEDEFVKINKHYYMRYGDSESAIFVKTCEIVKKDYEGNKAEILLRGYHYDPTLTYLKAILVYEDGKWVVDEFHNWI